MTARYQTILVTMLSAWVATVACFVAPAVSAETTLRVVTFSQPDRSYPSMVMIRRFIERVNKAGKGVLKLDYIGGPSVVPLRDQMNATSKGVVDMVMTFTIHQALVPEIGTVGMSEISPKEDGAVKNVKSGIWKGEKRRPLSSACGACRASSAGDSIGGISMARYQTILVTSQPDIGTQMDHAPAWVATVACFVAPAASAETTLRVVTFSQPDRSYPSMRSAGSCQSASAIPFGESRSWDVGNIDVGFHG